MRSSASVPRPETRSVCILQCLSLETPHSHPPGELRPRVTNHDLNPMRRPPCLRHPQADQLHLEGRRVAITLMTTIHLILEGNGGEKHVLYFRCF